MRIYEVVWMLYAVTILFCIVGVSMRFATSSTSPWRRIATICLFITAAGMVASVLSIILWGWFILQMGRV
jgi:hypothetical protein